MIQHVAAGVQFSIKTIETFDEDEAKREWAAAALVGVDDG